VQLLRLPWWLRRLRLRLLLRLLRQLLLRLLRLLRLLWLLRQLCISASTVRFCFFWRRPLQQRLVLRPQVWRWCSNRGRQRSAWGLWQR
jgi:hypothetical protein